MPFVLDASITLAWCFPDGATPYADSMLDALGGTDAAVPGIWPLEVANVLAVGERRRRLQLATQDGRLREAAARLGVPLMKPGG